MPGATKVCAGRLYIYVCTSHPEPVLDHLRHKYAQIFRKKSFQRRCMLKLKFKYGSISMILFNEEIPSWRDAIATAHDGMTRGRLRFTGTPRIKMTAQKLDDAQTKANMLETAPEEEGQSVHIKVSNSSRLKSECKHMYST
ncbi:hypothetical protein OESDEN_22592 [Oesophagostomum dentatum]|uniref:DUF7778 domain-containing protein n=1 Tax=Oesophagostomum dentatum TaxID=61180 RepID=A0A0B1RXJ4_OESDE|nr:hypothetical protein OESDEN_22592 [Oesophagostomum dentatum]